MISQLVITSSLDIKMTTTIRNFGTHKGLNLVPSDKLKT